MNKLAALTAITTLALGGIAEAKATDTGRHSVTKQVYVFEQAGVAFTGTAKKGWTFDVKRLSPSGKWAYGKVHGQINRHAWISADALRVKR